jgi:DNA repair photolyase
MQQDRPVRRGRGVGHNPPNRFERLAYVPDAEADAEDDRPVRTEYLVDLSRNVVSTNNSPDIPFDASINPYRGCEHGCAYCYARPTHEYLGFSAGLDFESKIMVKRDAAERLRVTLRRRSWQPQVLALSGVTDAYQPVERKLRITRAVLEVLVEFRNPVHVVTKNHLVTRDADLLGSLAEHQAANVGISIPSLDSGLTRRLEPRTSHPEKRLDAIRALHAAGVPVGVFVAPIIPGLNDLEIPTILERAADAGARFASFVMLRLPLAVAPIFVEWLETHLPERKQRILSRVRDMRGGRLNATGFGERMRGGGVYAEQIRKLFELHARRLKLPKSGPSLNTASFRRDGATQLGLFDDPH